MAKKAKHEQTIICDVQFTYILKGNKESHDKFIEMYKEELRKKVLEGFQKLSGMCQPWDDVQVTNIKVFDKE